LHTETGPGVYEAAITYSDALLAADRGVLFKASVKEIAQRHDIVPTFMARWNDKLPGSSGHIHQSLVNIDSGTPAFFDDKDPNRMSDTFKHYLAGIIKLLPELLPMLAPTVNSYKRLVEGFWAPTRSNWGIDNRTTALRVIPGSKSSTRLEIRVGGADINPYLAVSACLAAGAYGIRHKLPLTTSAIKGNAYESKEGERLPSTLEEAALKFKNSKTAREILGDDFVDHFANTRLWEWRQHKAAVTDWELKRYFEII
jgi:glutamine synthetase